VTDKRTFPPNRAVPFWTHGKGARTPDWLATLCELLPPIAVARHAKKARIAATTQKHPAASQRFLQF